MTIKTHMNNVSGITNQVMTMFRNWICGFLATTLVLVGGCATVDNSVKREAQVVRTGPQEKPVRNVTGFSDGLRCMDNLFLVHNVRDFVVLVEELNDRTTQVNAGTRDMLISAVSDMTRRSNAVQLITYSLQDSPNLVGFLERSGRLGPYENVPPFDIRGSISQLDRGIVTKRADAGVQVNNPAAVSVDPLGVTKPGGGIGISKEATATVLGLDLSVITTHNMAVIPGVTTHNSVAIYESTSSAKANALISKIGVDFNISTTRSEGVSQALRALVEMSTIELFGKLVKVPYWKCLGIAENHDEIKKEISDWYFSMAKHGTLIKYSKTLMQVQGQYSGPLDNDPDRAFLKALNVYKTKQGLPAGTDVGLQTFSLLLSKAPTQALAKSSLHAKAPRTTDTPPAAVPGEATPQVQQPKLEPRVFVQAINAKHSYAPGEEVLLKVTSDFDGYLYCYLQDGEKNIARFYPNRFAPDNEFFGETGVQFPGDMPFTINANEHGKTEGVFCYLTEEDVYRRLPAPLRQADFKPLPVRSTTELTAAFAKAAGPWLGRGSIMIKVH